MKTVLITGVSSGIGFGLLREFLEAGYHVVGSVRDSSKGLELRSRFPERFTPIVFDIANHWEVDAAAEEVRSILGAESLDGLVNNAGSAEMGPLLHVPISDVRKQFEALVYGQLYVIQKFYRFLLPERSDLPVGRIMNVSSISGESSNYLFGVYAAAKHAIEGLSKTLREELKIYGIKLIVVAPGNVQTALWKKQTLDVIEKYRDTDYYESLQTKTEYINAGLLGPVLSIEEISEEILRIFLNDNPDDRYTIVKERSPSTGEQVVVKRT